MTSGPVGHVVWDWNGTLLDDLDAVVHATNAATAPLCTPALDAARYRATFRRPLRGFYESTAGRELTDAEWSAIGDRFAAAYRHRAPSCPLAPGARQALAAVAGTGRTQSLLSMSDAAALPAAVARHGIAGHFLRCDGHPPGRDEGKAAGLGRHLDRLGVPPADALVVGDTVDDAHAAAAVGARAVLVEHGSSHTRAALDATGAPVVTDLHDVLTLLPVAGAGPGSR